MSMKMTIALTAACAMLAAPALAANTKAKQTTGAATADAATQDFVNKAAMTNMFEIQAGRIAQQKIRLHAVDSYATMIIRDHRKLQNQLAAKVKTIKGVKLPDMLDQAHDKLIGGLRAASGGKFLQAFRNQQVEGHQQGVQLFQNYAQNGRNAALKHWAQASVADLQKHLAAAQDLPTSLPAPTVGAGSSQK